MLTQDDTYKSKLLGSSTAIVVVEAGLEIGWAALTAGKAGFVGMTGFGASAPAFDLYAHFNITKEEVVAVAKARLSQMATG